MPVLRRRFKKVVDDDVAEAPVVECAKTPVATIGSKKSSRDPTFRLLLETPSANVQGNVFADWDAFAENSILVNTTEFQSHTQQQEVSKELATIPSQQDDLTTTTSQHSKKDFSKTKIPPLKANRFDDIRHHRGKEMLSEVSKMVQEFGVSSRIEALDDAVKQEFENSKPLPHGSAPGNDLLADSHDSDGWIPFDSGFDASLPQIDVNTEQISSPWNGFGEIPVPTQEATSPIVHEKLPVQGLGPATLIDCESSSQGKNSTYSEASMPETLNIANVLDQIDQSWEQASQSDIISVDNDVETSATDIFITLNSGSDDNSKIAIPDLPLVATEDSEAFSLDLDTMHEMGNNQLEKDQLNRGSNGMERQELLSPVPSLPVTPTGTASECSSPDSLNETRRYKEQPFSNVDETTKRYDRTISIGNVIGTEDTVGDKDHSKGNSGTTSQGYAGNDSRQADHLPSNAGRKDLINSAKQRIQKERSIHFSTTLSPKTHDSSLLDTESEVSDHVSAIGSKLAALDSISECEDGVNIIIDTGSFLSGDVSTMTGPHNSKVSDDSCDDSANHCGKSFNERYERARDVRRKSGFPQKTKVKPLGASTHEITMLNTFMRVAGPKLRSSNLSMEDREEIHNKALEAGLPDDFVHKMLDQTAGIVRWEEQSVRTATTASSTEASCRSKHSTLSSDSHSTRYTKDDESISYYSFREMKSGSGDFDEGAYGCFQGFKSSFWVESGLSGNDMMENVSAAFSESFDEISRSRQRRQKRRTFGMS